MKKPETVQTEKHEKPKMKKKAVLSRLLPYLMRYKFLHTPLSEREYPLQTP